MRPSRETLIRYFKGQSLPHEIDPVEIYLSMDTDKDYVESCIAEVWDELAAHPRMQTENSDLEQFKRQLDQETRSIRQLPSADHKTPQKARLWKMPSWMKVAAASLLLIGGAAWIIHRAGETKTVQQSVAQQSADILPGSDKARLTLSDGSTISLAETANGQIAVQEGLHVEKTREGEIVYRPQAGHVADVQAFNSIVTPNGGQYRVTLPDGSKALLNAASSLTYPVHFSDRERRVKMTGEVYFEIAKATDGRDKRIPFIVESGKQEIQVLGTTFNVHAYADEPQQRITLIEGSVGLKSPGDSRYTLLKPGQQALVGNGITVSDADMKRDLAWVNGAFVFRREELQRILRKIARWYDLEVDCPPELADMKFTGKVSRDQPLSAIIRMIAATEKIHVELKERRLIVSK